MTRIPAAPDTIEADNRSTHFNRDAKWMIV